MDVLKIEGGAKLSGCIEPQGSKNEALPVIAAVLLTEQKVTIRNIPDIKDIEKQIELLKLLGVTVNKLDAHTYEFEAREVNSEMTKTTRRRRIPC